MDPTCHQPEPTRHERHKKKIYERLQERFFLPDIDSRGVTHGYLAQVERQEVFVVGRHEMARFQAELTDSHLKRNPHCSRYEAFDKLKALLQERGLLPLGFEKDQIPEGTWLYSMLRFVDQENLSGVFVKALRGVDLSRNTRDSEQLYVLQRRVGFDLLSVNDLGKRPEIQECLEELWLTKRKTTCRRVEATAALNHARKLANDLKEAQGEMKEALKKATVMIYQAATGKSVEEAWAEQSPAKQRVMDGLKLAYTVECVLKKDDDDVKQLAEQFLR